MNEIEQLKADLATLKASRDLLEKQGCPNIALGVQSICDLIKKKIADLEAQQPFDQWADAKNALYHWDVNEIEPDYVNKRMVFGYIRHLEAKVAELEAQEQVDEWKKARKSEFTWMATHAARLLKERDDALAKVAKLDHELRCERIDGGKVRDDLKAIDAEKNRQKLAELTTILNAIPPVCGIFFYSEQFRETLELARELVERRIEGVKKEMQR